MSTRLSRDVSDMAADGLQPKIVRVKRAPTQVLVKPMTPTQMRVMAEVSEGEFQNKFRSLHYSCITSEWKRMTKDIERTHLI